MAIIHAYRFDEAIIVHRQVGQNEISSAMIGPDDPDWLEAVAALPPEDAPASDPPAPQTLAAARADATARVNAVRGEVRCRFITRGPGQDLVYNEKRRAARAWLAAGAAFRAGTGPEPLLGDHPTIACEVGAARTAPTADQVAQIYLNKAELFQWISAGIEGCAMEAFHTIDTATTPEDAHAAAAAFPRALIDTLALMGIPL